MRPRAINERVGVSARAETALPSGQRLLAFDGLKPGEDFSPSPGNPGEGRGEGDFERRTPLVLEITLILAFSRRTGRRDRRTLALLA